MGASRKIRMGIDVGSTFTHVVALDAESFEMVANAKAPTTHRSVKGVAEGITQAIRYVQEQGQFNPSDVFFVAHCTTQATNALLEGNVAAVGVLSITSRPEAPRTREQPVSEQIEIAPGWVVKTVHLQADVSRGLRGEEVTAKLYELRSRGAAAIVASDEHGADDPRNELAVIEAAREIGLPACGTHQLSTRCGLRERKCTAAVNASALPQMIQTADMTEKSVRENHIKAPVMMVRNDGGALTTTEARRRPLLTLLSGPAAGVSGALPYAGVSDGILLEVGGTSTKISVLQDGRAAAGCAAIGDHRTHLRSLCTQTLGLGGSSMIRLRRGTIAEVGPRSACMANLPYASYAGPEEIVAPRLVVFRRAPCDPEEYVAAEVASGERYALTVTCAAHLLGLVTPQDSCYGNTESARRAFEPLAARLALSPEDAAELVLERAMDKLAEPLQALNRRYHLDKTTLLLAAGGAATACVPFLARRLGLRYQIVEDAQFMGAIGAALTTLQETVERAILAPSENDVAMLRREAETAVLNMGAVPESITVQVEIQEQANLVRATATGALQVGARDLGVPLVAADQRLRIVANSMKTAEENVDLISETESFEVYVGNVRVKKLLGLRSAWTRRVCVCDKKGVIRLKLGDTQVVTTKVLEAIKNLRSLLDQLWSPKEPARAVPRLFMVCGFKIVDLCGLARMEQVITLAETELRGLDEKTPVILLAEPR